MGLGLHLARPQAMERPRDDWGVASGSYAVLGRGFGVDRFGAVPPLASGLEGLSVCGISLTPPGVGRGRIAKGETAPVTTST